MMVWVANPGRTIACITRPSDTGVPGDVPCFVGSPAGVNPGVPALAAAAAAQDMTDRGRIWRLLQQNCEATVDNVMLNNLPLTPAHMFYYVWHCTGVDQVPFGGVGGTGGQGLHVGDARVQWLINHPSGHGLDLIYYAIGAFMGDGTASQPIISEGFEHDDTLNGDGLHATPDLAHATLLAHILAALGCNCATLKVPFANADHRHVHMCNEVFSRTWCMTSNLVIAPLGKCVMNPWMFMLRMLGFDTNAAHSDRNPSAGFRQHMLNVATDRQRLLLLRGFLRADGCARRGPGAQGIHRSLFFDTYAPPAGYAALPAGAIGPIYTKTVQSVAHGGIINLMHDLAIALGFRCSDVWGPDPRGHLFMVVEDTNGLIDM